MRYLIPAMTAVLCWCGSFTCRGQDIYVSSSAGVGEYSLTTGSAVAGFTPIAGQASAVASSDGDLFVANQEQATVEEYNGETGSPILSFDIAGGWGSDLEGLAASGNDLYVANGQEVFEFDATTGDVVSGFNLSGASLDAQRLAISAGYLYVATTSPNLMSNYVNVYNATTGASVTTALLSSGSLNIAWSGLALSGTDLFAVYTNGAFDPTTIGEYNANSGLVISSSFASGYDVPVSIVTSGTALYVANAKGATSVEEFNTATGARVSGFTAPADLTGVNGIALTTIPEPGAMTFLVLGLVAILLELGFRRRNIFNLRHIVLGGLSREKSPASRAPA